MKKVVLILILAIAGVYGIGRFNLGESGAIRFLAKMESLMNAGKGEEICAMFHEDLEVEINDQSGESPETVSGGKQEFCDLTKDAAMTLNLLPHSMNVEYTKVNAVQDWKHPWTSEITYLENRKFSVPGAKGSMSTVSEDEITLVHTFSGVKLRKIKSAVYKADAT